MEVSDLEIDCDTKTNREFRESYNIEYLPEDTGDIIYLNPFFVTFFDENPFKLQERTYPIDFGYKDTYYYSVNLSLNNDYTIVELPKNINMSLPNKAGQITFSTRQIRNSLVITFKINFKEAIYSPEFYPYLKEFMSKIVDIQNNSIVLLKKNI
ncbi:DUF3858 domain-containing protein [uncultured Algibacter sp.]|uniref:DUF3858 domain-containing protein n=1 Tax=uncultured Algibacter sp. TaxID=298659 RepID=UPI002608070C|nr:DUF3858 domain-containing protein [uncultured Algibacter sp.]